MTTSKLDTGYVKLQVCSVEDDDPASESGDRRQKVESFESELKQSAGAMNLSFIIRDEDHTLGNSLRYVIMKNPEVDFCGYTVPHPSENKINFRIQTKGNVPAVDVFRKGLVDLKQMCSIVMEKYQEAVEQYQHDQKMETT
ncbi:unnamed protein product [Didymodactylos carnosus]|uniref:DNA-directed RNA polymerases I and III subunit RPAC2 n=1 Tax=Didymodactylos carnosus TaxID=1234261 RepID=A0A814HGS0_9BILA|nr:unnamed protein product [Didymodactylos carnosus]CAF1009429.1 unnamed protein product [Didymodactylos carnosus]CAF3669011.1 unnamed protein product [Didymodactylos carnosus]CAF3780549.1 unnamed protein product [Didymodactylos carnosus]